MQTANMIKNNFPNLENLIAIYYTNFEQGAIESITNLKTLTINPSTNCDIDFLKLNFLKN